MFPGLSPEAQRRVVTGLLQSVDLRESVSLG
jgi:hypothetical protein